MGQVYFSNVVTWKRHIYKHLKGSDTALSRPSRMLLEIFTTRILLSSENIQTATSKLWKQMRWPKDVMITYERKKKAFFDFSASDSHKSEMPS